MSAQVISKDKSLPGLIDCADADFPGWANWITQNCCGDIYAHEMVPIANELGWSCADMEGREKLILNWDDMFEGDMFCGDWLNSKQRI